MASTHLTTTRGSDARSAVVQANLLITANSAVVDRVNQFLSSNTMDQVVPSITTAGLSVDANPEDVETDNTIQIRAGGQIYPRTAVTAIDISTKSAGGATITGSKFGTGWAFLNGGTDTDFEVSTTVEAANSRIEGIAQWSVAVRTLPPTAVAAGMVAIGHVDIAAAGGGYTWGTTSTAGVSTFVDYSGRPGVEIAAATLALDPAAATFSYGTVTGRLGSAVRVAATGKVNVTIGGSTIADGKCGLYLLYLLADDVEWALQLGAAYADTATALAAVQNHNPNPYLILFGYCTILNNSKATFTPGTTNLDSAGITTTFYKVGPGTNQHEIGRNAAGQPFTALTNSTGATIKDESGVVITEA